MEGTKSWQKERRCPQEAGIKETMSGLLDSGVFELAEEDQNRYCANINIVAKPHKNIRNSKADKHVKKVSADSTPQLVGVYVLISRSQFYYQ